MPEIDKPDLAKKAGDHGHDDHGHSAGDHGHGAGDHGHGGHGLPPPEPDAINALNVFVWGFGMFAVTVVIIVWLGGYFWIERDAEDLVKVQQGYTPTEILQGRQDARANLGRVHALENGRYQVPITHAMSLVADGK